MSGSVAIETNRAALVRIVASLIAMAGGRPVITRHVWCTILPCCGRPKPPPGG